MGQLSTHVLDTMHGCPAGGMTVTLQRLDSGCTGTVGTWKLNADGRTETGPLLKDNALQRGTYRLVFEVGVYFRGRGVDLPEPAFIESVPVDFGIADPQGDYHVPLLVSPWAYSTYRGS